LITREEWARLLSRRGLEIVECIDAGDEVANSLHEPDRVDTLRELNRRVPDANVNRGIESYVKLGEMLRKGLMRYVLLTVRQATSTGSELLRANQAALGGAVPYRDVAPHRWLYELKWQASRPFADVVADAPNAEPESRCASGTWLVLADQGGVGRALATALEQRGGNCCLIEAGSAWQQLDENRWKLLPDDHAAIARLVREAVVRTGTPIVGVVHLWSLDDRPPGELTPEHLATAGESGAKSVLPLLQTLVQYPETGEPRFWFVTLGTVATEGAELPDSLASSCVWGLGRVFSLEYSHLWGGLIDLPAAEAADKQAVMVLNELLGGSDEDQVAYANGKRYVPRLVHTTASPPSPFKIEADATYLITGGLGALGGHVAQWLVGCGARNLVLCGRHPGHDAQARWAADHTGAAGCNVRILSADVAREEDVQQLLQTIESEHPPLRGVVHAAGVIGNERLAQMTATSWDEVLRPKLQGAWILHKLTEHLPLDFFVCFSSIAAIWGSAGQAHYAAGNAFLDALCRYRHLLGLPALSINWGPITGGGMLDVQSQKWLQQRGVHAMTPEEALEVLEQLLGGEASQMVAAKVDWPRFKATYESARRRPLLDCLAREDELAASRDTPYPSTFVQQLRDVPAQQRPDVLQAYVRQQIASTLGLSHGQIAPRQGLFDVGMDSLNAVELRYRFNTGLGVELPPTLLFDHPTVESLVAYLTATLPMAESTTARTEASNLSQLANDADLIRLLEEIGDMDENNVRKSLEAGWA
jgi:NAD(P)-dependent dehydrogenase (short-subunit alcohol dehydrogenase family)/acyl carrier protein